MGVVMRTWWRHVAGMVALLPLSALACAAEPPAKLPVKWRVAGGLAAPESAYYDSESGVLFLSQIVGEGTEKDGAGWISKIDLRGRVLVEKWVVDLNAPKGLRSHEGRLWVSDIDTLVAIDMGTGGIVEKVAVPGARFLNDVACADDGAVYVADMLSSKIHEYRKGKLSVFAEGHDLESPNGLLVDDDRLIVAAWGATKDFTTQTPGRLYAVDLKTKLKSLITQDPLGNLDGVESDGRGGYLVSDWNAGKVFHVAADGKATLIFESTKGTADLAYLPERKLLILPHMLENTLTAYDLSQTLP